MAHYAIEADEQTVLGIVGEMAALCPEAEIELVGPGTYRAWMLLSGKHAEEIDITISFTPSSSDDALRVRLTSTITTYHQGLWFDNIADRVKELQPPPTSLEPPATPKEQRELDIARNWLRAEADGVRQKDFADAEGIAARTVRHYLNKWRARGML